MKKLLTIVFAISILLTAHPSAKAELGEWWSKEGEPPFEDMADSRLLTSYPGGLVVDWGRKVAIVKGRVGINGPLSLENRQRLEQIALFDALDSLLSGLGLVRYDGFTKVSDFYTKHLSFQTDLDKLVKKTYRTVYEKVYDKENILEIVLEFDLAGKRGLGGLLYPVALSDLPSPSAAETSSEASSEAYTGLIIDASNLGVEGGLNPTIYDEAGNKIYSLGRGIDKSTLILTGTVDYALSTFTTAEDIARAGDDPMMITAKSRLKSPYGCDIVVSNSDAIKILKADATDGFLKKLKVVILL